MADVQVAADTHAATAVRHFWIMTVQICNKYGGSRIVTHTGSVTVGPVETREQLFQRILDTVGKHERISEETCAVLFFRSEPEQIEAIYASHP